MPLTFFDPKTGEFSDSAQARIRSKLMVNFGNPYREKRGNSLIPEQYLRQSPSMLRSGDSGSMTLDRPTSPPHDSFDSVEEGEAIFVLNSPSRKSPKREEPDAPSTPTTLPTKRPRSDSDERTIESLESTSASESSMSKKSMSPNAPPPPPPRPPAPKRPSVKALSSANMKQPPPPPAPPARPKSGATPPPPPPTMGVSAIQPSKKAQPLPPGKTQRLPPKPPKLESKQVAESNTSKSVEDLPIDVLSRPAPPENTLFTIEIPMGTELETNSSESKKLAKDIVDAVALDNFVGKRNDGNDIGTPSDTSGLPPLIVNDTAVSEQQPQQEQSLVASTDQPVLILDNEHVKPNAELLPGWICVWSKSKQRWYFFDTKTNTSVWNWPP